MQEKAESLYKNGEIGARVIVFNTTLIRDLIEFRLNERAFRVFDLTALCQNGWKWQMHSC